MAAQVQGQTDDNTIMRIRPLVFIIALVLLSVACSRPAAEVVEVAAANDNPILVAPAPTTPPSTLPAPSTTAPVAEIATTTTLAPLPVPDPLPTNPFADVDQVVLGSIEIPAIEVKWDLQQGMTLTAINRGPSQWPGTALPGGMGNMVIAGHRTTHGAPFRHLDSLVPGDEIVFRVDGVKYIYGVVETLFVLPTDTWIADQDSRSMVTLFACHPVGSARQRIVVKGELVEVVVPSAPTEAA